MAETEQTDHVLLTVNAGSSSVKLALYGVGAGGAPRPTALIERIGTAEAVARVRGSGGEETIPIDAAAGATHEAALAAVLPRLAARAGSPVAAAGHRIVHGGGSFTAPVAIDEDVLAALERLVPLARTHQPHGIAAVRAVARLWPEIPQIACFDTAFHATVPDEARVIALPEAVRRAGVRRYGFHGLSYAWVAERLPEVLGPAAEGRVVAAHLGNGASLCGMVGRESRATTMGFTTLDGLIMGERPGLTDPGAVLFMIEELGMSPAELRETLFRRSGLLGLSGLSNDMRTLSASDAPAARFAIAAYVHRAVREIAAIAGEIGGLDGLVFTGGVGENAAPIRAAIVERLGWLGLRLEADRNAANAALLSPPGSTPVAIIPTDEEAVIARALARHLGARG